MNVVDKQLYNQVKERVKARVERFPSAYASGQIVQEYKRLGGRYTGKPNVGSLSRWFQEKWVDVQTGKSCGQAKSNSHYPICRPTIRVSALTPKLLSELTPAQIQQAIKAKQMAKKLNIRFQ